MSPHPPTVGRRRIGLLVLGLILLALWALERSGGPRTRQARVEVAADGLVRDGVRHLSAPFRDARGRPLRRLPLRLAYGGDPVCEAPLREALAGHPVFRPGGEAGARLVARCSVSGASDGASPFARVGLTLRLHNDQGGAAPREVRLRQHLVGYLALVPPLLAVVLAMATGRILFSMLLAIFAGAVVAVMGRPEMVADPLWQQVSRLPLVLGQAAWWATRDYLISPLVTEFKLQIMGFAVALVGMISVVTRAGGIQGLLGLVGRLQGNPRLTRLSVWLMGLVLFFDDCANTLVVGSAARPLTDSARVSREKLAYLVDSTAAPVAGVALISTWIGFEVGLFQASADSLGMTEGGFDIFFAALPMRFYCLFTIGFVLFNALVGRDFGPMLQAERRAHLTGQVQRPGRPSSVKAPGEGQQPPPGLAPAWWVAAYPILTVLFGVLGGLILLEHHTEGVHLALEESRYEAFSLEHIRECFTYAARDNRQGWALLGAGLAGSVVAFSLARARRRVLPPRGRALGWSDLGRTYLLGSRAIAGAIGVLVCAWAIQAACEALGTSVTLTAALSGNLDPMWMPLLVFITAAAISFATGTSWGTMGILIPAVLPLASALGGSEHPVLFYLAAGAVLDGAIFGDHCSPISDTTVMSSLSSGCHHLDHIRTQLPYAITVMVAAAGAGYLGRAAGLPLSICYLMGGSGLMAFLFMVGRRPESSRAGPR